MRLKCTRDLVVRSRIYDSCWIQTLGWDWWCMLPNVSVTLNNSVDKVLNVLSYASSRRNKNSHESYDEEVKFTSEIVINRNSDSKTLQYLEAIENRIASLIWGLGASYLLWTLIYVALKRALLWIKNSPFPSNFKFRLLPFLFKFKFCIFSSSITERQTMFWYNISMSLWLWLFFRVQLRRNNFNLQSFKLK